MPRADLALVGFGHVGRRFAQLLEQHRELLRRDHQLDVRIIGISTARHGSTFDEAGVDVNGANARRAAGQNLGACGTSLEIIGRLARSDATLRVMVETTTLGMVDGQPAIGHVEAALDGRCHAITANKGPVAFAYRTLNDKACRAGCSFLFEGAVMDGIPIFNLVRETMPAVRVLGFRGIVNTTTQHILAALERGEPFAEALARMQAEGIAEADASLDVEGWDPAAKAAALANVLMDGDVTPHLVERVGLGPSTADAVRAAAAAGRRLRLVASASGRGRNVRAAVRLTEIEPDDILFTLPDTANALVLTTDLLGEIAVCQMAGNLTQTAYGLLSDLVTIARRSAVERRA
jgi:homoserine dehydrogenase